MPARPVHGGGPGSGRVPPRHRRSAPDGLRFQRGAGPRQLHAARRSPAAGGGRPRRRRAYRMTVVRPFAPAVGALAGLALGALPAAAGSPSSYGGYEQGAYLAYLNAPASGADRSEEHTSELQSLS